MSVTKPESGSCGTTPTTSASSRGGCSRVSRPATVTRPGQRAPGEVRHEPVDAAQQRRLAGAGASHHQHELALGHVQVDVGQRGRCGAVVGDRDVLEPDHAATSSQLARPSAAEPSRTTTEPGGRGATTPASAATAIAAAGQQRQRRPRGRRHLPDEHDRVRDRHRDEHGGRHEAATGRPATRAGPTGRGGSGCGCCAARRAACRRRRRPTPSTSSGRPSAPGVPGVEQRVDADADADETDEQQADRGERVSRGARARCGRSRASPWRRRGRRRARGRPRAPASPSPARARRPRSGRPRSRRAVRTRATSPTSCGANVIATTTATPTS